MSFKSTLIDEHSSLLNAVRMIDANPYKVALVIDDNGRPIGTVTDGDIRRALLKGHQMDNPVSEIMNKHFTAATIHDERSYIDYLMASRVLKYIPIIDDEGRVVDIKFHKALVDGGRRDYWVVIMAGGLGKRLLPLTEQCPKPMLQVNGKPILERIICDLRDNGFKNIFIAVNYKSEIIENYFANGKSLGVNIKYVREEKRLGTAGALSLLPKDLHKPITVMNGDLLTSIDFHRLIDYHEDHKSAVTVCVSEYDFEVPYGVVNVQNSRIVTLEEKPIQKVFINAGIYVLDPIVLDQIPEDEYFDMTHLIAGHILKGENPMAFPIHEQWMDIGNPDDFAKANGI